jgi:hypothetical protein
MLAFAPGTGYVHEPFSPATRPGVSAAPFERYYTYVTPENEARYLPALERTLAFDYDWGAQLRGTPSVRDGLRAARDAASFARSRVLHARPVVKDPIALLSAPWLAERFGMRVVVLIRHPAGFAGSIRKRGMTFRFETLLDDERLVRERLAPFEDELREQVRAPGDFVDQAALLWRVLYATVADYRSEHPDWLFVRHEDLAAAPLLAFARLYSDLDLQLTPLAVRRIEKHSTGSADAKTHDVRQDSRSTIGSWHKRLTAAELERLHDAVTDVSQHFYTEKDWS